MTKWDPMYHSWLLWTYIQVLRTILMAWVYLISLLFDSIMWEIFMQECIYNCYLFLYMWVIYVFASSTKDLLVWYWAYYMIWWQNLMHITNINFSYSTSGIGDFSCLEPIKYTTLKMGAYFASQLDFLSKFLIITKSFILWLGMSS